MLLRPMGWLYGMIADIRNALYDRGTLKSYDLGARTISVGNITAGGTGKTPLVAHVAKILSDGGEKVCILTRGYGRKSSGRVLVSDESSVLVDAAVGGDEPVELARKLIGKSIVVADADRVAAARWAKNQFGITAFVLDDGFQHRRVKRTLDIVCIDATNPFGGDAVLPAGRLRERFENIGRADVVVVTRSDLVHSVDEIKVRVRDIERATPIFLCESQIVRLTSLTEFSTGTSNDNPVAAEWTRLREHGDNEEVRILAFCALGNPKAFFTQLSGVFADASMNGEFDLSVVKDFPDHHHYTQSDVASLEAKAQAAGVHAFLTTVKDAVKLAGLKFELPCYVVEMDVRLDDDAAFREMITS